MRKPPQIEMTAKRTFFALSVSPCSEDHLRLEQILGRLDSKCVLRKADTPASAAKLLRRHQFAVVVCEYDLSPGSWRDVLAITLELPFPSSLVVTSRLADERKWAEVLNLGGCDLLNKPFSDEEVWRVVDAAWSHWCYRHGSHTEATRLYRTASGL